MARVKPDAYFCLDNMVVTVCGRDFIISPESAKVLADDINHAFLVRNAETPSPLDMTQQAKENLREFFDDRSLFNDKAINDALSTTISQNDQLTNAALILANNVAAVMKLHGFTFDQAMLIVGVVMDKEAGRE